MKEEQSVFDNVPNNVILNALNMFIKVESINGDMYNGELVRFDDQNGNVELQNVTCRLKDLSLTILERVIVKGDNVRLIYLPTIMRRAPLLQWSSPTVETTLRKTLKKKRKVNKPLKTEQESLRNEYKQRKRLRKLREKHKLRG